jgi:hypothetical protein
MTELLNYLHSFSTTYMQATMTELLNYLHSFNAESVQGTMTELLTQFLRHICSSNNDRIT